MLLQPINVLKQLDLSILYQKAAANFKSCIPEQEYEFIQKIIEIPLELIRVEDFTIDLTFKEYNLNSYVLSVTIHLYNHNNEKIGEYLHTEDQQGHWINYHLDFHGEYGLLIGTLRAIIYPFQEQWVIDKKRLWVSNNQYQVKYTDGKTGQTTQHIFPYEGEATEYLNQLERAAQDARLQA